jgi:hypothetical protein
LAVVHTVDEKTINDIFSSLDKYDLIITQNVKTSYRGNSFGTYQFDAADCPVIKVTNTYYSGQLPQFGYIYDPITKGYFTEDYNDVMLFKTHFNNLTNHIPVYDESLFIPEYNQKRHEDSLAELIDREQDCDVRVADFITKNYRKQKLFHTINHPCKSIVREVLSQVLDILELDLVVPDFIDNFAVKSYPIYASTSKNLGLEFTDTSNYTINNVVYTPEQMYDKCRDYYSTIPKSVVDYNLKKYINY